jgi:hypothetical protein
MDADRFDTLARSFTATGTRRRALAGLGGALGLLGLAHPDDVVAAKSGKCKPKCDECEKCDKGKCERKNGEKRCKKGKCKPKAAGTSCTAFAGGLCQNGTCVNVRADEASCGRLGNACGPTQVCQDGSCFSRSTCPATITSLCTSGTECASGSDCFCARSAEGNVLCLQNETLGPTPPPCQTSADCPPGEACVDIGGCGSFPDGTKTCMAPCPTPTV